MTRRRPAHRPARRARAALAALLATTGALAGCTAESDDRPHVMVTTNILGDVTSEVVGDAARVTTLMKPDADPHSFEISARQAGELRDADLVVSNGLGLEEGLVQHLDRAAEAGAPVLVAGDHVDVVAYSEEAAGGAPDPHFWTDPARMVDVVDALEEALVEIDGIDAATVREGADAYRAELATLDEAMGGAFASIPDAQRSLVTNHHVFGYLAQRFDFELVGAVIPGGTTLASPSAADLEGLASSIEDAGVRTIFAESSQPDQLVRVLADEVGIDVEVVELYTESLTDRDGGAPTYLEMQRANTERITDGLS
ncbi:zinc/manganese transport system substrate-binding protein [Nocardioides cavernae]|uniref:Zinc/manganese transport system substrate-binding protein n=1 Tax=Nocardioides cavernae TaxID=1921566 RepID=A0A7Y9H0G6_9ACTN|nr:zinc ABC transporter substrate-binding protein AztC [Nocardioides cavernae]NYE35341.1 zinc/manganese transport system substrate-binding protein [Nocardioides cavernae]